MSDTQQDATVVSRRAALRSAAGVAGGVFAASGAASAAAQSNGPDFDGWFDDVDNFDGVADGTGQSSVTVTVGAAGNGGNLAFDPAAVRVDPGTTVVWEWTGEGGGHNVVAEDGAFDSGDLVSDAGYTFERAFEDAGVARYVCTPHESLGMKGAIVVGDGDGVSGGGSVSGGEGASSGGTGGGGGGVRPVRPTPLTPSIVAFALALFVMVSAPVAHGFYRDYLGGAETGPTDADGEPVPVTEAPDEAAATHIGHDEFDPVGTLTLVLVYLGILVVMWAFTYFVEFLGGPTVVG